MQPGNLNLLETSGPVQACNGIALHFYTKVCQWTLSSQRVVLPLLMKYIYIFIIISRLGFQIKQFISIFLSFLANTLWKFREKLKDYQMMTCKNEWAEGFMLFRLDFSIILKPRQQKQCKVHHEGGRYDPLNPLKTKRRPLYLKTQSVPRCKHFSSRL